MVLQNRRNKSQTRTQQKKYAVFRLDKKKDWRWGKKIKENEFEMEDMKTLHEKLLWKFLVIFVSLKWRD